MMKEMGKNQERMRLGDVCEIISGSTPKTDVPAYWNGDLKWITPAELKDDAMIIHDSVRKITSLAVEKTGLAKLPQGTVILSSRAPIGKVAIAGCELYCNQGFKNLVCSEAVNNHYLFWFLKAKKDYLNSLGRGATFKEISKSILATVEIDLPAMSTQKRVASELESITSLISLRRQQLERLNQLAKSQFIEMFGDQFMAFKNWPSREIQEIADVTVGVVIQPTRFYVDQPGVKAFRSLNVSFAEKLH